MKFTHITGVSTADSTAGTVLADAGAVSSNVKRLSGKMPLFVPRSETFYWTPEWQYGEQEALKELERGEGKVFHDPEEAVRWLMEPEEE